MPRETTGRLLSALKSIPPDTPFTEAALERAGGAPAHPKRKRTTRGRSFRERGRSRTAELLAALCEAGVLEKRKGSYYRKASLDAEGTLRMNSSGNGILEISGGMELVIHRDMTGGALDGDSVRAEINGFYRGRLSARVKSVSGRKKERFVALIEETRPDRTVLRIIDFPGEVQVCAETAVDRRRRGDICIIRVEGGTCHGLRRCVIEETYTADSEELDLRRIMIRHSLPGPHGTYAELESLPRMDLTGGERSDFRDLFTITIDGEDAKDFDDAISLERGDGYRLFVHIADVSHFVKAGGELDRQAMKRGNSYYLGDTVIPMLPETLSNDLCSLREGVDRLTMTAVLNFSPEGKFLGCSFTPGIIRVDRRLTYTGAEKLLDENSGGELPGLLSEMHRLAMILKGNRMAAGRIDLELPEERIVIEKGKTVALRFSERLRSHMIIEEFMLSANEAVSRALREKKVPSIYRVHEPIAEEKFHILGKFLRSLGLKLDPKKETGIALQEIVDAVSGKDYEQVVNLIILKSMMQAYYGEKPLGHFGLGFRDYTHFTSPIRRYPDLVVHRCLKSMLRRAPHPYGNEELMRIGGIASDTERTAQRAERDLVKIKSCRLMDGRIGEVFDALVSGVGRIGMYVALVECPIEGLVPLRLLTDDYYLVMEDEFTVVGKRLGRRFRLGDRLKVRLAKVDIAELHIDFELAR